MEKSMRTVKDVYSFNCFREIIDRNGCSVEMNADDFCFWENGMSTSKHCTKPVLADTSMVEFRRGSMKIFWKDNMDSKEFSKGEFLRKKILQRLQQGNRFDSKISWAVAQLKKEDILKKLCPLMPSRHEEFWANLAINNQSNDLISNQADDMM